MSSNDRAREPVILSAARTPLGRFQGALSPLSAPELGAVAARAALERAGLDEAARASVDEVLFGNVVSAGLGQAPARQVAIGAGLPPTVSATTLNKVCGSGLKACMVAAQVIKAGDGDLILAGGMESMSNGPHMLMARRGLRYGHAELKDAVMYDGLEDPFEHWQMGMAAEWIADRFEVTREAMDRYALESHRKAIAAIDAGKFKAEIVPVEVPDRKGPPRVVEVDEPPRRDTSLEKLAALKPAFKEDGRVTAGNAPGLNDGAAALVIASRARAEELGRRPMARILAYDQVAVPPREIFHAPALLLPKLFQKVGWTFETVDLIELNEAFAAQILANGYYLADQGWDWSKVNVHGGAIALGHPLGATGARILVTLLHALKDRGLRRGVAALCLGGGEAVGMAVELEDEGG